MLSLLLLSPPMSGEYNWNRFEGKRRVTLQIQAARSKAAAVVSDNVNDSQSAMIKLREECYQSLLSLCRSIGTYLSLSLSPLSLCLIYTVFASRCSLWQLLLSHSQRAPDELRQHLHAGHSQDDGGTSADYQVQPDSDRRLPGPEVYQVWRRQVPQYHNWIQHQDLQWVKHHTLWALRIGLSSVCFISEVPGFNHQEMREREEDWAGHSNSSVRPTAATGANKRGGRGGRKKFRGGRGGQTSGRKTSGYFNRASYKTGWVESTTITMATWSLLYLYWSLTS